MNLKIIIPLTLAFSMSTSYSFAQCRKPASFLSDSQSQITSNYINYLICLHNQQNNDMKQLQEYIIQLEKRVRYLESNQ